MKTINKQKGGTILLTVIIIAAATLIMAYSSSVLGLGELGLGYTSQKGSQAFSMTDGCMEETLYRIQIDANYGIGAGTINLPVGSGSCDINVTDLGENQRRITISGTIDNYTKTIETELTVIDNIITIISWVEK